MDTTISKKVILGRLGEEAVLNWLNKDGVIAQFSNDQFDRVRDIKLGKKNIEVKTQVPFFTKRMFTVGFDQFQKMLNADFVFFVSVPLFGHYGETDRKVYSIKGTDLRVESYFNNDKNMIGIPFDTPGLNLMFEIKDENLIDKMMMHTSSNPNW